MPQKQQDEVRAGEAEITCEPLSLHRPSGVELVSFSYRVFLLGRAGGHLLCG